MKMMKMMMMMEAVKALNKLKLKLKNRLRDNRGN